MSFISILKTVLGIEHTIAPFLSVIPGVGSIVVGVDAIVQRVQAAIGTVEASNPGDGQGSLKAPAVIADFNAGLDLTQQVLALKGEKLAYDPAKLQDAIDKQVAAYNAFAALKSSFQIVKA